AGPDVVVGNRALAVNRHVPAGVGGGVHRADRVVDVVVPGVADVGGGDGAVRVDHGVSADRDDHGVRETKQLAAVDGLRAGGVHRARGHARDHHVARI